LREGEETPAVTEQGHLDIQEVVETEPEEADLDQVAHRLWRKALRFGTWDPAAIDLSRDRRDLERLTEDRRAYLERFCAAFRNAEENVARRPAPPSGGREPAAPFRHRAPCATSWPAS
jgi:hypothetical protein